MSEETDRTIQMLENELRETEDALVAMERDRDELLETVNQHGVTPVGELEEQIRWLKQRIAAKEEDFDFTSALADGYKAQRDDARCELNGGLDADTEIVDLTGEETLRPTAAETGSDLSNFEPVTEDVVTFHAEGGGLVADKPVGLPCPQCDRQERVPGLIADFRQAIEERDDARKDLGAYMVRTTVLEEALARADADLKNFQEGAARGEVDETGTLRQEVRDLEDAERNSVSEINDLVHVIADNTEKENNAATVITYLRKRVSDLTIRTDELSFERDRLTEAAEKHEAKENLASRVIMDLRGQVQSLIVQKEALTTDPSRLGDLEKELEDTRRARDLAQLDRHNLTEKLKYWENVAPNTAPELIVSTLMEERDAEAEAGREARNERETARRERDNAQARLTELSGQFTDLKRELSLSKSEVEQLDEELTAVRDQRDEKETIIGIMNASSATFNEALDMVRADEQHEIAISEQLTARIATLNEQETEAEDLIATLTGDLDRTNEENTTLGLRLEDAGLARKVLEEKVQNLTYLLAATDAKVAALREKIEFIGEAGATTQGHLEEAERRVEELIGETDTLTAALELAEEKLADLDPPTVPLPGPSATTTGRMSGARVREGEAVPVATPRDKFPPGIGDCRLGYDGDEGIYFDRTKPAGDDLLGKFEECDPTEVAYELEKERDTARCGLEHQKTLTADRLAEQRTLERELRTETEKTATLRKNLHQAIKHIDQMTNALMDRKDCPSLPECLQSGGKKTPTNVDSPGEPRGIAARAIEAANLHECGDGCSLCDATEQVVKPAAQVVKVAAASLDIATETDTNASACIRVWTAPTGFCNGRKGNGSLHGFAQPDPAVPGPEITPYCPSCNQPYTRGPDPETEAGWLLYLDV